MRLCHVLGLGLVQLQILWLPFGVYLLVVVSYKQSWHSEHVFPEMSQCGVIELSDAMYNIYLVFCLVLWELLRVEFDYSAIFLLSLFFSLAVFICFFFETTIGTRTGWNESVSTTRCAWNGNSFAALAVTLAQAVRLWLWWWENESHYCTFSI